MSANKTTLEALTQARINSATSACSVTDLLQIAIATSCLNSDIKSSVTSSSNLPLSYTLDPGHITFVADKGIPVVATAKSWVGFDGVEVRRDCGTELWTWGYNANGQLGNNSIAYYSSPITTAGGGTNWCTVGGYFHSLGIKSDGTLWTWGRNTTGQLGDGTTIDKSSPISAAGGNTWTEIKSGNTHSVSLKTDGTLWTWGNNGNGQLGDGTTVNKSSPVTISGTWSKISTDTNSATTVAIKTDGTLWMWGCNTCGQLGDGTIVNKSSPVTVSGGGINWCLSTTGTNHSASIKTDGTLWSWGANNNAGHLGDGTTTNKSSPVTTAGGGTNWCIVSAKFYHSLAIKTDGTLWTWGCGNYGQLANGLSTNRCSPATVTGGGTNWCNISIGGFYTNAIKTDGTLWTWGYNGQGQLGDGSTSYKSSPVTIAGGGTNWWRLATNGAIKRI
jgi:alpha-tubulin suppressor-like RCC1 family protein